MSTIFTSNDSHPYACTRPFAAYTPEVAYHDPEVARLVARASQEKLGPSVMELKGQAFPWVVPVSHHNAPMWLHWLGDGFDEAIRELPGTTPTAEVHRSNDLLQRREVICWNTSEHAFCASARGLTASLSQARTRSGHVLAVFLSATVFASVPVTVGPELLTELGALAATTDSQFHPLGQFSRSELATALLRSVLMGNEPAKDGVGREIVLLKKRALPADWHA